MLTNHRPVLYAIKLPVRYQMGPREPVNGHGRTLALSSTMVRFATDQHLRPGRTLNLVICWPASLPDGTGLNLWITGKVILSASWEVEVQVKKYEFRTRRGEDTTKGPFPVPSRAMTRAAGAGA